jgi:tyrosine-protein kinase Etk/Wzc
MTLDPSSDPDLRVSIHDSESGSVPSLLDYLEVIARRFRMIAAITAAVAVISVIYSLTLPNIYSAKTMILPAQEDKNLSSAIMAQLGGLAGLAGISVGSGSSTTDLYVSLMKSSAVKDPIIDRFKLMELYNERYRIDASNRLDKNAVITAGKKDGIISVTVDDKDPTRAAELANAYADELGKLVIRLNISGAGQNRIFLEERLTKARADLAMAEENLKSFQSKNKSIIATEQAKASIQQIVTLREQLLSREVQLNTLRRTYTESSQEVKNMAATVDHLRKQIARLEGSGNGSVIPTVGAAPALGQEYIRLIRAFKTQESLVEFLTKQYEMTRINEAKDVPPFQVIQKAQRPERKTKPARAKMVLTATAAALFFSIVVAFVRENISRMSTASKGRWKGILKVRG